LCVTSRHLDITTANQYKYLMQQISVRGWRTKKSEPGDETVPQEQPQAFRMMIEVVYGKNPDFRRIRKDTGIPMGVLRSVLALGESASASSLAVLPDNCRKEA
jgi:hypothetical protein